MSQYKDLVRNINKGKNLEENIPVYRERLAGLYQDAAFLHITMDYFVLYESLQESAENDDSYIKDAIAVINEVVGAAFGEQELSVEKKQELVGKLLAAREDMIRKMKILTMYTDKLQIYEHVINRIELKYENEIALSDVDTFVQKVYQYIFGGKDQVVVNESIKEILSELPVRMARSKYFQLIEDSLSVYKDSDKSSVDRYVYMLETSAMLYEPEGVGEYFLDIKEFTERLGKMYFSALSEAEFHMVVDELQDMAEKITKIADLYVGIQGILNNLYCYLAADGKREALDESQEACLSILRELHSLFENGEWKEIPVSLEEKLVLTEGRQERLVEDMLVLEAAIMDIQIGYEAVLKKLELVESFETLGNISKLMSAAGTFIDFAEEQEEELADEAYIKKQTQALLEKLKKQFADNEMCINRAVIAATISKFPVFFTSSKEVEEYIRESLERCNDDAERQASMNVIQSMIEG